MSSEKQYKCIEIKRQVESNPYVPKTEKEILKNLKKSREEDMFRAADDVIGMV